MVTVFVRHTVANYAAWRKGYNAFQASPAAKSIKAEAVYQSADNPNDVTVTHDFASLADAKAFAANDALKQAMQSAGVVGAPTIWFTNKA